MKKWTKKRELISRIDAEIISHGFIKVEKMIGFYEAVYADECNKAMNACNGKNYIYKSWLKSQVKKFRGNVKDLVRIGDDGKKEYIRRWGYDSTIDAYVFQCKLVKNDEQIHHAINAHAYKVKQAKTYHDATAVEHKAIKEQIVKVEKEQELKRFLDSQPKLFEVNADGTYGTQEHI